MDSSLNLLLLPESQQELSSNNEERVPVLHPINISENDPDNNTGNGAEHGFKRMLQFIYAAHFLARWGAGMWDFNISLFMISIWPQSLLLTATYGLVEALSIALFGVYIGEWLDKTNHLKVIQYSVTVRNGSVITAAVLMILLLLAHIKLLPVFFTLVALVDLFGALGTLAGLGCNILLERDWVVSIAKRDSNLLVEMNTTMRRIDLACKLLAPVFVGALMSGISILASVLVIAAWNLISLGAEYWLLNSAFNSIPELHSELPGIEVEEEEMNKHQAKAPEKSSMFQGWMIYLKQQDFLAALALAILYFTVLSFGSITTAALEWKGVPAYIIGISRGLSACVGVGATYFYPTMHAHLQAVRTGLWSVWIQWFCLMICLGSVFIDTPAASSAMLIVGIISSRFGLWSFDLAVTQLMQSSVSENERGVVGGVQNSLQSFMDMMAYVMAILISRPQDFSLLIFVSFGSVTTAGLLFSVYTYKVRGHLFHFDKVLKCL